MDVEGFVENFDHHDPAFVDDPYPVWAAMRERCPIAHSDRHDGFWIPTGYADIYAIAQDPATFSSRKQIIPSVPATEAVLPPVTIDPPEHTKYRRLLLPEFSPKVIAKWEPVTWQIANDVLDGLEGREQIDGVWEYAQHIPMRIVARMLGVDEADSEAFAVWVRKLTGSESSDPDVAQAAVIEAFGYLATTINDHRAHPRDDTISALIAAEIDGERLNDIDLLGICFVLLMAGIDTTWSSISSSLHYLATHPTDRHRLVAALDEPNSELWNLAVEEFLRAFAPVTMGRCVTRDTEMHGEQLREGDMVLMPYSAANRDPRVFQDPDEVIIDRRDNRHFAFGVGIHRCLGSNLGRMDLRVALQAFLRRYPDFDVAEGATVRYTAGQARGPKELPLVIKASRLEPAPM